MDQHRAGHAWANQQYGYPGQQQSSNGYAQQARPAQPQPMVVIPQYPQENMGQFYQQQNGFAQSPVSTHQPSPLSYYQQSPQQMSPSGLPQGMQQPQQMQYMQQQSFSQPHARPQQYQVPRPQQAPQQQFQQYGMQPQQFQQQPMSHFGAPQQQQYRSPQVQHQNLDQSAGAYQMPLSGIQSYASPQLQHHQLQQGQYAPISPVQPGLRRASSNSMSGNMQAQMHRASSQSIASPVTTQQSRAGSQSAASPMQAQFQQQKMQQQHQQQMPMPAHSNLQQALSYGNMPSPVQPQQQMQSVVRKSSQQFHSSPQAVAQAHRVSSHVEIPRPPPQTQSAFASPMQTQHQAKMGPATSQPGQSQAASHPPVPAPVQALQHKPSPQQPPKTIPQQKPVSNGTLAKPASMSISSHGGPQAASSHPEADYHLLLLALAEQFITAARSMSFSLAQSHSQVDLGNYQDLIHQGLTCLDSALTNWKTTTDARGEARLRMHYANLLFEETDDDDIALAVLTKGITLCDRHRFTNQKLSLQHLQVRIQYKTNRKAAFKSIDTIIEELVAYRNAPWIYVFRFLRVSLAMQSGSRSTVTTTLQQLKSIVAFAASRHDVAVEVLAHVLEALLHLKVGGPDAFEQARSAIAAASSHQLHKSLERIPQLRALLKFADASYYLATNTLKGLDVKMSELQSLIDSVGNEDDSWTNSTFRLPTTVSTEDDVADQTAGILRKHDGKITLSFNWLNKNELCILGFLMSGVARLQKNCMDERAEKYLNEGISFARKGYVERKTPAKSLGLVCASTAREESLCVTSEVFRIFALANASNWSAAAKQLQETKRIHSSLVTSEYDQALHYLDGVIKQGSGLLQEALKAYTAPSLVLPSAQKVTGSDQDLRILATLNRVAILKLAAQTRGEAEQLLDSVFPLCQTHHIPGIRSAANVLRTTHSKQFEMIKLKNFLSKSLCAAQEVNNTQIVAIVLNIMAARFFGGIIGDQAKKSAIVTHKTSAKLRSPLWNAISSVQLSKCNEVNGSTTDAQQQMAEAVQNWEVTSPEVRKHFEGTSA